jgi:hypothetical protein
LPPAGRRTRRSKTDLTDAQGRIWQIEAHAERPPGDGRALSTLFDGPVQDRASKSQRPPRSRMPRSACADLVAFPFETVYDWC